MTPILKVKKLHPDAKMPVRSTEGSTGYDVFADFTQEQAQVLESGVLKVPTGICVNVPHGYDLSVRSRSGMACKGVMVANGPGTIDTDYTGQLYILLMRPLTTNGKPKFEQETLRIKTGDKIAQLVVTPVVFPEVVEVNDFEETERGDGGFGSTGR